MCSQESNEILTMDVGNGLGPKKLQTSARINDDQELTHT